MKKVFKKLSLLILALVLIITAREKTYAAKYDDVLNYEIKDDGGVEISDCNEDAKGELKIPSKIDGKNVTSIGYMAFYNCSSLTSVIIPSGVTSIGDMAFEKCGATNIEIPNSVITLGTHAFYNCKNLTSINIPDIVTSIGNYCFFNCSNLKSVKIPASINNIPLSAFEGCNSLINIEIPDSVTNIDYSAFKGCSSLITVTIPKNIKEIGGNTFEGCSSLENVIIPNSVTSIVGSSFKNCSNLKSITIPENVTTIGSEAFSGCSSLSKVLCFGNAPYIYNAYGITVFSNCSPNLRIYAKNGLTGYDNNGWEEYRDRLVRYDETLSKSSVTITSKSQVEKIELSNDVFKSIASIKSYEDYDNSIILVDNNGNITPLRNGKTNVRTIVQYFDGTEINLNEEVIVNISSEKDNKPSIGKEDNSSTEEIDTPLDENKSELTDKRSCESDDEVVSPKTGDIMVVILSVLILGSFLALVVTKKKFKIQK